MKVMGSRKGFLFTLATIILVIPLIYLVVFYSDLSETKSSDAIESIRCDELHYFVNDVKVDMGRAVTIFGRRAALTAIDKVSNTGVPLATYGFNCTAHCNVDCDRFTHPENGSEAAIAELVICGTFNGVPESKMENNTLMDWMDKIISEGDFVNFNAEIEPIGINVVPSDAWHFSIIVENKVHMSDKKQVCFQQETIMSAISNTSIEGLEDPLFYLFNMENKLFRNCDQKALSQTLLAESASSKGKGIAGGRLRVFSNRVVLKDFCQDSEQDDLSRLILVWNSSVNLVAGPGPDVVVDQDYCLTEDSAKHFAGFIQLNGSNLCAQHPETVPGVCNISSEEQANLTEGTCAYLLNNEFVTPKVHNVYKGVCNLNISSRCYFESDVEEIYNGYCVPEERKQNGPSFFDRLDGRLFLSDYYVEQSEEYFGTSVIGVESFMNMTNIYASKYAGYGVELNNYLTQIDYLYMQDTLGSDVVGLCDESVYSLKLDAPHAYKYGLDTKNESVSFPGSDTICPADLNLSFCKEEVNAEHDFILSYTLNVDNALGNPIALSQNPNVTTYIFYSLFGGEKEMTSTQLGVYAYTFGSDEAISYQPYALKGNVLVEEGQCSARIASTDYVWVDSIPLCP